MKSLSVYDWFYLFVSTVFLCLVFYDGFILHAPMSRVGDVIEHVAAIDAWLERPFSPENPALNSAASSPRFIPFYFPFILIGSGLGWSAWLTYDIICLFGAVLFLMGIRSYANAINASSYAPIFLLVILTGLWTNPWNFSSVYEFSTAYRIAGYPSILAFSLSLFTLAILIKAIDAEKVTLQKFLIMLSLTAVVIACHVLTGVFLLGAAGLYILFHKKTAFKFRAALFAIGLLGVCIGFLWPFYGVLDVAVGTGGIGTSSWISSLSYEAERVPFVTEQHPFYQIDRIYPILLGVLCALFCAKKRIYVPLLGIIGFSLIYILNIYVRIPLGHRFIIYALFFSHVAIAIVCLEIWGNWSERFSNRAKTGLGIIAAIAFSGVTIDRVMPHLKPANPAIMERNLALSAATEEDSVIAGSKREIWMLTPYDRRVLTLLHPNPLVPDRQLRSLANAILMDEQSSDTIRKLAQNCYGVTHLVLSTGNKWKKNESAIRLAGKLQDKGYAVSDMPGFAKLVDLRTNMQATSCPSNAQDLMWNELLTDSSGE